MAEGQKKQHLIAMFQGEAKLGEHNLGKMEDQMARALAMGAELIIFPELFLTGYQLGAAEMKAVAEERFGPSFQQLAKAARESNMAVVYGYAEVDCSSGSEVYYNSAQLVNKDGKSLANFRKLHLWIDERGFETVFTPGKEFAEVVECCGMKIGLLICFDVEFPEAVRTLVLRGAQLIAVPTAVEKFFEYKHITSQLIPTRAMENRVHVAYANHCGGDFAGRSVCCDPAGDVVALAGQHETLVLATVNLAGYDHLYSYLAPRRPELYKDLVA